MRLVHGWVVKVSRGKIKHCRQVPIEKTGAEIPICLGQKNFVEGGTSFGRAVPGRNALLKNPHRRGPVAILQGSCRNRASSKGFFKILVPANGSEDDQNDRLLHIQKANE